MSVRDRLGILFGMLITLAAAGSLTAQVPEASASPKVSASKSEGKPAGPAKTVDRLVEQLKRHSVPRKPAPDGVAPDRFSISMMELASGEVTLIADEPAPGLLRCGSPVWSHDGRRILFDATPGKDFSLSRLQSIELGQGQDRPVVADFGAGNCPTFAPDDHRIAFLSNANGVQNGIWMMKSDGSERHLLGEYGIPKWSPDGRQMMIVAFGEPRRVTLMDVDPEKSGVLTIPGSRISSIPSWAGNGMIAAVVGTKAGDQIAVIDVSNPAQARIKEVLWRRASGPDVTPTYPMYLPDTGLCVFVGGHAKGMSLYSVRRGKELPAKPLGKAVERETIVNLAFSPDGRYVLFSAHGRD